MPCYDPLAERDTSAALEHKVNQLTDLLCQVCSAIDNASTGPVLPSAVSTWYRAHKAEDDRRRAQEAEADRQEDLREQVLAKLSPEERHALGHGHWRSSAARVRGANSVPRT